MYFIKSFLNNLKTFLSILIHHINHDRMTTSAASLAYTTALSLVPLCTVLFSLLSAFPIFKEGNAALKDILSSNLAPAASKSIEGYLEQFVNNTNQMTAFGVIGLMATSVLLIYSIDSSLNYIWHTQRKRSLIYKFTMYWTILSLGPILIGASTAVSSYIFSIQWLSDGAQSVFLLTLIPFFISVFGFWLLYCIVPTEPVPIKESLIGAFVAACLFAAGKRIFVFYVSAFPSYQLIYGVLATIPLLLIWIYCSWCIILFGAEFSVSLVEFNQGRKKLKLEKKLNGKSKEKSKEEPEKEK